MNKTEIKSIVSKDLTPRYETARDSVIKYVAEKANELKAYREDFNNQDQTIGCAENPKWRAHYIDLINDVVAREGTEESMYNLAYKAVTDLKK